MQQRLILAFVLFDTRRHLTFPMEQIRALQGPVTRLHHPWHCVPNAPHESIEIVEQLVKMTNRTQ